MTNEKNKPIYAWFILFFLKFSETSETCFLPYMKKSTIISSRTLARIHSVVQFRRSCCVENSRMRSYLLFFTKIPSSASEVGTESLRRECELTKKKWKDAEQKYSSEAEEYVKQKKKQEPRKGRIMAMTDNLKFNLNYKRRG